MIEVNGKKTAGETVECSGTREIVCIVNEAAIAKAEKDADRAIIAVHNSQIEFAVMVEITGGQRGRPSSGEHWPGGLKRAVAIAEKNRDGIVALVGYGQVKKAVIVEVGGDQRHRKGTDNIIGVRQEAAVAVVEQY